MSALTRAQALERSGRFGEAREAYLKALRADPRDAAILHRLGCVAHRLGDIGDAVGRFQQALAIRKNAETYVDFGALLTAISHWDAATATYEAALRLAPTSLDARYGLALAQHMRGNAAEAVEHYRAVLAARPELAGVHNNLGIALQTLGRHAEAVAAHREGVRLAPADAGFWNSLGTASQRAGAMTDAEGAYREALRRRADYPEVWHNLACLYQETSRPDAARAAARRMTALSPADPQAWRALGNADHAQCRWDEAARHGAVAVRLAPDDAESRNNLASALMEAGRLDDATAQYRAALERRADFPVAETNLARLLQRRRDLDGARTVLRGLLGRHPWTAEAWRVLGLVLMDGFQAASALAALRNAVVLSPDDSAYLMELGGAASQAGRVAASVDAYRWSVTVDPANDAALGHLIQQQRHACDWRGLADREERMIVRQRAGADGVSPFCLPMTGAGSADLLTAARRWARVKVQGVAALSRGPWMPAPDGRLRIGYLSSDLREHAVAHLFAELLELHDRVNFAVTAYSTGADDGSAMRQRLMRGVERFVDLRGRSDADAARVIAGDGVDILVDVNGYTAFARTGIMAARPAPVQVNWLGYPGTMGAPFIDYLVADPVVIPEGDEGYYDEAVVRLPWCYQANDRQRPVAEATPTRESCGLPPDGFVFCCFNSPYKLSSALFGLWARLLHAVPRSVLWLYAPSALVADNLRREASARGVAAERLVFAPPLPQAEHLARHRLADLFLDTLPYNAHTTGSDALWAGLPVLTCRGATFAGRVGASLLRAVGLPELITESLEAYEAAALRLAGNPTELAALRARLAETRVSAPLFDTPRFTRRLEAAYRAMWDRHRAGGPPRPITIMD